MPLKISHPIERGNTVPYPSLYDNIRRNHGFVDLRARPDLVPSIPEARESQALAQLLTELADGRSTIMTVGCDLGERAERRKRLMHRRYAGGYVQVAPLPLGPVDKERLLSITREVKPHLRRDVGDAWWEVKFALCRTVFEFGERVETFTLWIWFDAAEAVAAKARRSREALLESLAAGLRSAALTISSTDEPE